jgi:hypothetical protein
MPYTTQLNGVSNSGVLPSSYGFGMLCLSLLLLLIPAAVGFLTLRKKPGTDAVEDVPPTFN